MARYTRIFSLHPLVWLYLAVCFNASALTLNEPATKVRRDKLAEGLAVSYYLCEIFNHVDAFSDRSPNDGEKGPPILVVDYRTGYDNVLTNNLDDGVGAHISGYILLAKAGT